MHAYSGWTRSNMITAPFCCIHATQIDDETYDFSERPLKKETKPNILCVETF